MKYDSCEANDTPHHIGVHRGEGEESGGDRDVDEEGVDPGAVGDGRAAAQHRRAVVARPAEHLATCRFSLYSDIIEYRQNCH